MNITRLREHLKREGWLLAAILACTALCLLMGATQKPTSEESRISQVLSTMAGAGRTEVAVYYDGNSVPCGAVVVAEGADSIAIRLRLREAVSTLLGLEAAAVAVYPLEGGMP